MDPFLIVVLFFSVVIGLASFLAISSQKDKPAHLYVLRKGWRDVTIAYWLLLFIWIPWMLIYYIGKPLGSGFIAFVNWKPGGGSNRRIR